MVLSGAILEAITAAFGRPTKTSGDSFYSLVARDIAATWQSACDGYSAAAILQTQAILKDQLTRCMAEGVNLAAAISSRRVAFERAKREAEQVSKEKEAVKNETKRYGALVSYSCSWIILNPGVKLQRILQYEKLPTADASSCTWRALLRRPLRLLIQSRGSAPLPQVSDLVRQKAALQEKTRLLKSWRRKVEVAELEARTVRADLKVQACGRRGSPGGAQW